MRITCDQCSTRYSIADEKVRGKLVKIRCKKCQHTILVHGEDEITDVRPTLVSERNDSSQLFSLDQLKSIVIEPQAPARVSQPVASGEGSGLIDIQAMARAALSVSPAGESSAAVPTFSPALAMPILMPRPAPMPSWIWGVVIGSVLALSGTVLAVLARRPPPPVTRAERAIAPIRPEPVVPPARPEPVVPKPVPAVAPPIVPPRPASRTTSIRRAPVLAAPVAPAVARAAESPRPAPKDELTTLLDQATHGDEPARHVPANPEAELPEQLGRAELARGFTSIQPQIESCFQQADARGPAMVALVIAPGGAVSAADVRGPLAGSATGDCLARAARAASFKRFRGPAMSITYAFIRHGRP